MGAITTIYLRGTMMACETIDHSIDEIEDILLDYREGDLIMARYLIDENIKAISDKMYSVVKEDEESFHKRLRKETAEHRQLLTSHSTNPEWNPEGYSKNFEDVQR